MWREEWEVPSGLREGGGGGEGVPSPARSAKGKEREILTARGKKRVSSGHAHIIGRWGYGKYTGRG
jgi:hypothetical protein